MNKFFLCVCCLVMSFATFSQSTPENTLLWRISGKDLSKPSYIFGTIHLLCEDDLELSDNLKQAVSSADKVYLELDMDNFMEMLQAVQKMKMRNDTTLSDLLAKDEYDKVKAYFSGKKSIIPFSVLETYKPMLAASLIMQTAAQCDHAISMEQLIMEEAKHHSKEIKGMETMAYQLSMFDSIPYGVQAKQLINFINDNGSVEKATKDYQEMAAAYRNQQLDKLEKLINKEEFGFEQFSELLLYRRNNNWVNQLQKILASNSIVLAVGAGHLPGEKGILNLLRKAGYSVEPVENKMFSKNMRVL